MPKTLRFWKHAIESDAVILTKDEDFAALSSSTSIGPPIVWLRLGNATNRVLLKWLEPRWPEIIELLDAGNRLIEVR